MKVMTVVGTRPEIIRLARVIPLLDETVDHVLVHTGQNYDYGLNEVFFEELDVRAPDHYLGVDTSSLGSVLGGTLIAMERLLEQDRPDALLVLGDTNSSIATLMAKRMRVPVYHMEAGNRSFDENVPEEINRRMVDHISDFNMVYTEHARRNLLAEGIHPRRITLTGSPMREVLDHFRQQIEDSSALERLDLTSGDYVLVSAHREENVDSPARLGLLLDALKSLRSAFHRRVIVSTHPRTRKRLEALGADHDLGDVEFMEPFGFFDYCWLQTQAFCVLSDSGTISEESAILGFPAVTIRDSMERPEALEAGSVLMSGLETESVLRTIDAAVRRMPSVDVTIPVEYTIKDTSARAVGFILSTVDRHEKWAGLHAR